VTQAQRRLFILVDEWLGVVLLCWLWHAHREAFWPVAGLWGVFVYGFGYVPYWLAYDRWWAALNWRLALVLALTFVGVFVPVLVEASR
jgi:hypothetical protein